MRLRVVAGEQRKKRKHGGNRQDGKALHKQNSPINEILFLVAL